MRRYPAVLWLFAAIFMLSACSPAPNPPTTTRARTPVPTWTLPFELPTGTANQDSSVAVLGPTATATLAPSPIAPTDSPTLPPASDTPPPATPSDAPARRPAIRRPATRRLLPRPPGPASTRPWAPLH